MSKIIFSLMMVSMTGAWAMGPEKVKAPFHVGYIPGGFDSNDNSQAVAEGVLPNTCYKVASVESVVDDVSKVVTVTQYALKYHGVCLMMLVPFEQSIDMGLLKPGTYTVKDGANDKVLGTLPVKRATTESPDDFPYAPVNDVQVFEKDGDYRLLLKGLITSSCFKLGDVVVKSEPKVLVVLPILTATGEPDCAEGNFPFERVVDLDRSHLTGRMLVHTRSTNGQSVNRLVTFN